MADEMVRLSGTSGVLVPPGGGETVRAFTIFAVLLAVLVWASHHVAFEDMSQLARTMRMNRASQEAQRVAEAVTSLGRGPTGMDFYRLRKDRVELERFLSERLADRPDLRFVEVRDRFGVRFASVPPGANPDAAGTLNARATLMVGGVPQGEVRVGVSTEAIDRDIESMRRSLRIKVALLAGLGVGLLAVGFFYSLHLIRKNRALEHARQSSERVAYRVNLGSGLAHEIRNPLNSMNMNLQMLGEELQGVPGLEGGEHVDMLRSMQGEIKRIANLIDVFLQYARPATPQFEVRDLNDVLNATARFLQADFRQSGVELVLDLEPLLPSVEIDEGQLRQALLNILGNARQVTPQGGRVRLASRPGMGGEIVVEVADTGPGIAPDAREKIFEPFFSKRAGGTGLGLAIARQMVDNHGGRIEVDSELGKGTTFRIRLPRRHNRPPEVASRGRASR
jgi:signal transduction histidine kinase